MRAKRINVLPILLLYVIGLVSCKDWGEVDPPAGNQQIGEAKETVAEFTFETLDMFAMELGTYEGGVKPELVRDEKFQSNVLHLNGGYIGMDNPLIGKTIENGVSVSLWTKMSAGTVTRNGGQEQESQNETPEVPADSNGALLSFTNDSESFVIMQDGSVLFRNESIMSGVQGLSDGEWHYWTLSIGSGYISLYADGSKKAESELSADAYGSLSVFLTAGASNMYIGYGSTTRPSEMWVEDLKFVNGVMADDEVEVPATLIVVGATDFSTGWWQAFSPVWTIEGNAKFSCEFKNYSSMKENYYNYILVICNGVAPGKDGYKEYAIIRADNFGWIDAINDDEHRPVFSSSFNENTFKQDMNEATVNMSFTRNGNKGEMKSVITTVEGVVYNYTATIANLPSEENIGVFLTVENAYIEISTDSINITSVEERPENQIGSSDCTSIFYSETSEILKMKPASEAKIKFKNYTQGTYAYQNWYLVVNNGFANGTLDFKEYALLRADNWGWLDGDKTKTFAANNCAPINNYKVIDEAWSDFKQYMDGATVDMTVRRLNNKISMNAVITTVDNIEYNYYWKYSELPADEEVGICLTIDNSYLVIEESSVVEKSAETIPHNQLGTSDFMTGWWEAFTPIDVLKDDGTVTYTFVNHSNRVAAWNNWALGVSNGMASSDNGYQEYAVVRADNYGYIKTIGQTLNFTTSYGDVVLAHILDGANVTLTVKRQGVNLDIQAVYTKDGQTYTYGGTLENVVPADGEIGAFLTVDGAYLTDITSQVDVEEPEEPVRPELPETVYFNDFEDTANNGCKIHGSGSYQNEGGIWGQVFQNGSGAQRTHYLQLPADVLSHSADTKEMTVAFWVNAKNAANYDWAPMFMAYAAAPFWGTVTDDTGTYEMFLNTSPMFACQSRGVIQINCGGWCDFLDALNVKGVNTLYYYQNDWFADDQWHYYTVVLTETNAKVYLDGDIKNEWNVSGDPNGGKIAGLFTNGAELKYICLGGNQAWAWRDNDAAFMFDDFAVYNQALTQEQIKQLISNKQN